MLTEHFGIDTQTRVIALVGGGGKTTLMFALAAEMLRSGASVVTTTTTKIFLPASHQSPLLILMEKDPDLDSLSGELDRLGHVTVGRAMMSSGKVDGVAQEVIEHLRDRARFIVVEADGAARRPIKAPAEWEPVIPELTDLVIPVVGLDCLGHPAGDQWVFRLERFLEVTGLNREAPITPQAIGRLMGSSEGSLKGVPPSARVIPFLNKSDLLKDRALVAETAGSILREARGKISQVVAGTVKGEITIETYGG